MAAFHRSIAWIALLMVITPVFTQEREVRDPYGVRTVCDKAYMELVLDRSFYPNLDPNMLYLNDSSCQAHSFNESHIVMRASLEGCGTWFVQYADTITFHNFARTIVRSNTTITRHPEYEIHFSCHYYKTALLSLKAFRPKVKVIVQQPISFGKFDFKIDMYQTEKYLSSYSNFPVKVHVGERIYLQVKVRTNHTQLVLFVENCKATPTTNADDPSAYPLIKDGCTREGTLDYRYTRTSFQRFNLKAFRFIPKSGDVYIHCQVVVCHKRNSDSRCDQGCPANEGGKRRRHLAPAQLNISTLETEKFHTQLGPLHILADRLIAQPDEPQGAQRSGGASVSITRAPLACLLALFTFLKVCSST